MSKYNEKSSLKGIMGKNDTHVVVDAKAHTMKCFDAQGNWKWTIDARCDGVNGPGWKVQGGDTPPGLYEVGMITETQNNEPSSVWNSFGKFFCDLVELENQEASLGRAGVGVHGGGTGLKDPLADKQGWKYTHGCCRLQNGDLKNIFVPMCKYVKKNNGRIFVRIIW